MPSEQKGKRVVEEVLEESETEERPWTKVGANGRFSRYHKENVPLQQRQELIGSSSNPMGLSKVISNQSQRKSNLGTRLNINQINDQNLLTFDLIKLVNSFTH